MDFYKNPVIILLAILCINIEITFFLIFANSGTKIKSRQPMAYLQFKMPQNNRFQNAYWLKNACVRQLIVSKCNMGMNNSN